MSRGSWLRVALLLVATGGGGGDSLYCSRAGVLVLVAVLCILLHYGWDFSKIENPNE